MPDNHDKPRAARASGTPQQVLMLGCGKMGGALLQRWCAHTPCAFTAVSPSGQRQLPDPVRLVRGVEDLGSDSFDALVIAVKPQKIAEVLPAYLPHLAAGACIASLAAGTSCAAIAAIAPDHDVLRIMPNLPVAIGRGVSAIFAPEGTGPGHRQFADALMTPTGRVLWTASEDELDRVTAIAGSGPGFAFEILRCWAAAAEDLGFEGDVARQWVLEMVSGSIDLALDRGEALEALRREVTSLKGTTAAGLDALNGDGELDQRLQRTLRAAYERAVELR